VTPIAAGGILYLPAGNRVVALDGDTGKEIWGYAPPDGPLTARGLAYWPGDGDHPPRIVFTAGRKMIALEAGTGKPDVFFGTRGAVDLTVAYNGVPTIYKNVVVIGATVGELPTGPPGNSRAYDARTGAKLWEFHSVPQPGEPG
jgi:glucose dehydrogenase